MLTNAVAGHLRPDNCREQGWSQGVDGRSVRDNVARMSVTAAKAQCYRLFRRERSFRIRFHFKPNHESALIYAKPW